MTEQVDTDALRIMGATLTIYGHPFGSRITAAADELDQHVKAIAEQESVMSEMNTELTSCISFIRDVRDENDRLRADLADGLNFTKQHAKDSARERRLLERDVHRLRAAVKNAPHEFNCHYVNRGNGVIDRVPECTCWKAGAL